MFSLEYKDRSLLFSMAFNILHNLTPTVLSEFSPPTFHALLNWIIHCLEGILL